ncbi:MAG: dipicolinate synthase subunit B [Clostridia bacterium]
MKLKGLNIGLGICGSFCNHYIISEIIEDLKKEGANVIPIITENVKNVSTRFGKAKELVVFLKEITGNEVVDNLVKAEPMGPKNLVDIICIVPCTGVTIAKFANSIMDSPVLLATKSHLRNCKPVVIGVATNDGLGLSFQNIAKLLNTKDIYFVPFGQDDCIKKPKSLVFKKDRIVETLESALDKKQIQPLIYS